MTVTEASLYRDAAAAHREAYRAAANARAARASLQSFRTRTETERAIEEPPQVRPSPRLLDVRV